MIQDPTEPDAVEDALGNPGGADAPDLAVEAPADDTAEQHTDLAPRGDEPLTGADPDRGSEGDLVEQARTVTLDEDDYR
ncbi:hypothetical protein KUM39_01935 [Streptomyces sp. J2-1]|uniref:hypothetical protein n=1 Tax=Streptomyces corallincola TaxID=2851888 RepID=UPI001C395383|nr:hypothetical protein [Streptomyces corallincola]MBV2353130.1 hypothetical protein [Streptomyces corallincola]